MNKPRVFTLAAMSVGALVAASLVIAGPLNPPSGPVASTHKTLTEVEPRTAINAANTPGVNVGQAQSLFRITQPGSYYLTGNIAGVANKHGIDIAASGVTLDLNGFELVGGAAARGGLSGVFATLNGLTNVTVRNGSARNWTGRGVSISVVSGGRVTGVNAVNCQVGIEVGPGSKVSNCSASESIVGIQAGLGGCRIENCSASGNGRGISAGNGCLVTNCSANQNTSTGISAGSGGSQTPDGSTVADCTANSNTTDGISGFSTCVIRNNTCRDNGNDGDGAGIYTGLSGTGIRIEGNHCSGADRGIESPGPRNLIIRNTCSGNTINWVVGGNSVCGPIQNHTGSQRPSVLGFSLTSFIGEANDNFTY